MRISNTIPKRALSRIVHASCTKKAKEMMSGTQPQYGSPGPARSALKLNPSQVPAFTAEDMQAYLHGAPSCSLGPTLSGQPPTVESVEFVGCKELTDRLKVSIGLAGNALVCYVVLRGPFHPTMTLPPGAIPYFRVCETAQEIYDASTGRLLVTGAGSFKPRPGW